MHTFGVVEFLSMVTYFPLLHLSEVHVFCYDWSIKCSVFCCVTAKFNPFLLFEPRDIIIILLTEFKVCAVS